MRALILALLIAPMAWAAKSPVYTGTFSNTAVGGFDAVSFFTGEPVEGSKDHVLEYNGATWRFASAANKAEFEANPEAYAPQYGGYCAWAVAQGKTAKGDPEYWRVVDDKLYLNFNASVQSNWEKDIPGFIVKANEQWPSLLN